VSYPDVSQTEIANLYRESFSLGHGQVSAESFFAAANESKFFIKSIKMNTMVMTASVDLIGNLKEEKSNYCFKYYYHICEKNQQAIFRAFDETKKLGVEDLCKKMQVF